MACTESLERTDIRIVGRRSEIEKSESQTAACHAICLRNLADQNARSFVLSITLVLSCDHPASSLRHLYRRVPMPQSASRLLSIATRCVLLLTLLAVVASSSLSAQESKKKAAKNSQRKVAPELVAIEEQPGLPRVLLIGDSISIGYTLPVRELLKDKANVVRPLTNCGPTTRGVASIEDWLGNGKWDVIHFNFGLHDLVYFAADGKTRVEPTVEGARHQVSADDYEKHLRTLVDRLKKTDAKLIWCTTTPVPEGSPGRLADEAVLYNSVAAKVMQENMIAVNDLHAFAVPQLKEIQLPKNVHFTPAGSKVLASEVARVVEAALPPKPTR